LRSLGCALLERCVDDLHVFYDAAYAFDLPEVGDQEVAVKGVARRAVYRDNAVVNVKVDAFDAGTLHFLFERVVEALG